jgi:acetyl-CoA carboxylase carboxyltransferase component
MVDKNASMYLGSPRMAEMVIGEKVTLEELGGARMHCSESGCGDVLVKSEEEAIAWAKRYLAAMPQNHDEKPARIEAKPPKAGQKPLEEVIPADENKPFDMFAVIDAIIDEGSFIEIKKMWAKELITGFARIDGRVVGIVANQPKYKGGVLFVDSADKAARFIWLCDAFNVPLLYLADVPGFMIGTVVEKQGIIRAGAKMIAAVSEATVPKLSVIVRKAYGAGLYAMCGPAFEPDACLALPGASIAVMGPSAAVNAVFYNKIQAVPEGPERDAMVKQLRDEYREDIDLVKLASEMVIDGIVPTIALRDEISRRFSRYAGKAEQRPRKKHIVPPV